jgi:hypothetical protein
MNLKAVKKLLSMLPDGPKKDEIMTKIRAYESQRNAGGGLHDVFEFIPRGHIKIEAIDAQGNSLGILADQPNLVVKGAEEILLRAFSGDPERTLYKNRIPKGGTSPKYHIGLSGNVSEVVNGVDQLAFAPNIYWKAVDDSDFDVYYSYRPLTVFLKEETSDQVGKKAFSISTTAVAGSIPITAEIYSSQSNLFIGIGDGRNYKVPFSDPRLVFSAGWSTVNGKKVAEAIGESVTIEEKMTNFVIEYEKSNAGGQIEVWVDNVLKDTIETFDSSLSAPVVASKEYKGLDNQVSHKVEIKFAGNDPSVIDAKVVITEIRTDGLTKDMNALFHEFENFTRVFDTVTTYNTTNVPPFYAQLEHFPVDPASVVIDYNGTILTRVDKKEDVAEGKYFVDAKTGKVYFNRTLSGLQVTYNITGEHYALKDAAKLSAVDVIREIKDEALTPDGTKTDFALSKNNLVAGSVVVKNGGTVVTTGYTVDDVNGVIKFATAPLATDVITVDYNFKSPAREFVAPYEITSAKVFDYATGEELTLAADDNSFDKGKFKIDATDKKKLIISDRNAAGNAIVNVEIVYMSDEAPGFETGYKRAVIEKPKAGIAYPWYQLDKGSVSFIAEFPEKVPNYNVTIREMGLFDGPRADDNIEGFNGYPVDAFSLVRVGETRKEVTTGIRVTWTITLLNKDGNPFYGGF